MSTQAHLVVLRLTQTTTHTRYRNDTVIDPPRSAELVDNTPELLEAATVGGCEVTRKVQDTTEDLTLRFAPRANVFDRRPPMHGDSNMESVRTIVETISLGIGAAGGAAAFLKVARDLLLEWLKQRGEREVLIKIGQTTVHIKGSNDIDIAADVLKQLPSSQSPAAAPLPEPSRKRRVAKGSRDLPKDGTPS